MKNIIRLLQLVKSKKTGNIILATLSMMDDHFVHFVYSIEKSTQYSLSFTHTCVSDRCFWLFEAAPEEKAFNLTKISYGTVLVYSGCEWECFLFYLIL